MNESTYHKNRAVQYRGNTYIITDDGVYELDVDSLKKVIPSKDTEGKVKFEINGRYVYGTD